MGVVGSPFLLYKKTATHAGTTITDTHIKKDQ